MVEEASVARLAQLESVAAQAVVALRVQRAAERLTIRLLAEFAAAALACVVRAGIPVVAVSADLRPGDEIRARDAALFGKRPDVRRPTQSSVTGGARQVEPATAGSTQEHLGTQDAEREPGLVTRCSERIRQLLADAARGPIELEHKGAPRVDHRASRGLLQRSTDDEVGAAHDDGESELVVGRRLGRLELTQKVAAVAVEEVRGAGIRHQRGVGVHIGEGRTDENVPADRNDGGAEQIA